MPALVDESLTTTVNGAWVVWAYKAAWPAKGGFRPLTGSTAYPVDAIAECQAPRRAFGRAAHEAPEPDCAGGFHAISSGVWPYLTGRGMVGLAVVLSGRVLAFEWGRGNVLFRASRQTVVR
ncbi:MAG: hypothetical protein ACRDXE_00380, partial [Acidimicrobiales bacterium]